MDTYTNCTTLRDFIDKHRKDHKFQCVTRYRKDAKSTWYYDQPVICDASQDEAGHFQENIVKTCLMTASSDRFTVFTVGDDSILITNVNDPNKKMEVEVHLNAISEDLLKIFQGSCNAIV